MTPRAADSSAAPRTKATCVRTPAASRAGMRFSARFFPLRTRGRVSPPERTAPGAQTRLFSPQFFATSRCPCRQPPPGPRAGAADSKTSPPRQSACPPCPIPSFPPPTMRPRSRPACRPRLHPGGRLCGQPRPPGRGAARLRQDHPGAAIPPRRGAARRALPLHHPLGEPARARLRRLPPRLVARRHRDLRMVPPELSLDPRQQQSLVHSSDLELGETVRLAIAEIDRVKPQRVVFDSLSEIRLLSQGSLRYRRHAGPAQLPPHPRHHRAPPRRPHRRAGRPQPAQPLPRGDPARAARPPLWRRAPAPAGDQERGTARISAAAITIRHPPRRPDGVPRG